MKLKEYLASPSGLVRKSVPLAAALALSLGSIHTRAVEAATPDAPQDKTFDLEKLDLAPPTDFDSIEGELESIPEEAYQRIMLAARELDNRFQLKGKFIVVDGESQVFALMESTSKGQFSLVIAWPLSTAKKGFGFTPDSGKTPTGAFKLSDVDGIGKPIGRIYTPERYGQSTSELKQGGKPLMTTRVIYLEGLDPQNKNTRSRSIVLHATNKEGNLGTPDSGGCFRLGNGTAVFVSAVHLNQLEEGGETYMYVIDPSDKRFEVKDDERPHALVEDMKMGN